ncbi:MAG: DUF1501 domain-containing protein, partial [Gammaproteobacteria bacterium]|nr:DUF1501 domain-containing protein [Gammaproteobacteria bacterium]
MHLIDPNAHTRRAFLRRSGQLAMAGTALPFALNLAAMGEAAAQAAPDDDYKALVCVFLFGGCDHANTVVAHDDWNYGEYSRIRLPAVSGGIAIAREDLAATVLNPTTPLPDGRRFALHPSLKALADIFNRDGRMAVQLNVGPLIVPLTRKQYDDGNRKLYPVPPKLFSHNDQQSTWQAFSSEGVSVGWGGSIGDLMLSRNSNSLFTCISVAGNAVLLSGETALQYQVSTGGAVRIQSVSGSVYDSWPVKEAMAQLISQKRGHLLENAYSTVVQRSVALESTVNGAISPAFAQGIFPSTHFGNQLSMVARLIRGRSAIGARRQVFFVSL